MPRGHHGHRDIMGRLCVDVHVAFEHLVLQASLHVAQHLSKVFFWLFPQNYPCMT